MRGIVLLGRRMQTTFFTLWSKEDISNTFFVSLRYGIVSVLGVLLSVAFARFTTPELYGQYQFILSVIAFLSFLSLPGLNIVALRSVAEGKSGAVKQAVKLSFLWSCIAIPILVGYGAYEAFFKEGSSLVVGLSLVVLGLLYPLWYAPNTWYAYYEGKKDFRRVSLKVILSSAFVAFFIYLGLLYEISVFWLAFLWLATNAFFSWFYFWQVARKDHRVEIPEKLDLSYGVAVSVQKSVISWSETLPVFIISFFIGYSGVAQYQIASGFLIALVGLLGALTAISLPTLFSQGEQTMRALFLQNLATGIFSSLMYFLVVKVFFLILYGEAYKESYNLALALSFLPLLIVVRLFFVNILTVKKRNREIIASYILSNIVALGALLALLPITSFVYSLTIYFYSINSMLVIFLTSIYFAIASKKTDSIS